MASSYGRYRVEKEIARGDFSILYQGVDPSLGQRVLLKVLALPDTLDARSRDELTERFRREAEATRKLNHPSLPRIHEVGGTRGQLYVVMRPHQGKTLRQEILSRGPLDPEQAERLALAVLDALGKMHSAGICQGRLCPEGVTLPPGGRPPQLLDFGFAQATPDAPAEMPGAKGDVAGDLRQVGALLHEALTGKPPRFSSSAEAGAQGRAFPVVEASIPVAARRIILRALSPDPSQGYASAEKMAQALTAPPGAREPRRPVAAAPAAPLAAPPGSTHWEPPQPEPPAPAAMEPAGGADTTPDESVPSPEDALPAGDAQASPTESMPAAPPGDARDDGGPAGADPSPEAETQDELAAESLCPACGSPVEELAPQCRLCGAMLPVRVRANRGRASQGGAGAPSLGSEATPSRSRARRRRRWALAIPLALLLLLGAKALHDGQLPGGGLLPQIGDTGSAVLRRVVVAGGSSGDVQCSLAWDNYNDLDLWVDHNGEYIGFPHPHSSVDSGCLDVDMNVNPQTTSPCENIFWAEGSRPGGEFAVYVHHFRNHGGPDSSSFTVRVLCNGRASTFRGQVSQGSPAVLVTRFRMGWGRFPRVSDPRSRLFERLLQGDFTVP